VHPLSTKKFGANKIDHVGADGQDTSIRGCRPWPAKRWERGLEELDQRQGYRGPVGHLAGKSPDKRRLELKEGSSELG